MPSNEDNTFKLDLDVQNIFKDFVGDDARNEFEEAMKSLQILTDKAASFSLLSDDDIHMHDSLFDDSRSNIDTIKSQECISAEAIENEQEQHLEDESVAEESIGADLDSRPHDEPMPPNNIDSDSNEAVSATTIVVTEKIKTTGNEPNAQRKDNPIPSDKVNSIKSNADTHTKVVNSSSITTAEQGDTVVNVPIVDSRRRKADLNKEADQIAKENRIAQSSVVGGKTSIVVDTNKNIRNAQENNFAKAVENLPIISFQTYAIDKFCEDEQHNKLVLDNADVVRDFLEEFEFQLRGEVFRSWFTNHLKANFFWSAAKSIIISTFGYRSPRVVNAILDYINTTQSHCFNCFFMDFSTGARVVHYLRKDTFDDPYGQTVEGLIDNFIKKASCVRVATAIYELLNDLFQEKKMNQTLDLPVEEYLNNGKQFIDVPSFWYEFEKMIEGGMDYLASCEKECEQVTEQRKQAQQKKRKINGRRRDKFTRSKQSIRETQIAMSRVPPNLISARKGQGLCVFCGIVKHTAQHYFVCKEKKRLVQEG